MKKITRKIFSCTFIIFALFMLISLTSCKKDLPTVEVEYTYQEYIDIEKIIEDYNSKSGIDSLNKEQTNIISESSTLEVKDGKLYFKDVGESILTIKTKKGTGKIKVKIIPEMIVKASNSVLSL